MRRFTTTVLLIIFSVYILTSCLEITNTPVVETKDESKKNQNKELLKTSDFENKIDLFLLNKHPVYAGDIAAAYVFQKLFDADLINVDGKYHEKNIMNFKSYTIEDIDLGINEIELYFSKIDYRPTEIEAMKILREYIGDSNFKNYELMEAKKYISNDAVEYYTVTYENDTPLSDKYFTGGRDFTVILQAYNEDGHIDTMWFTDSLPNYLFSSNYARGNSKIVEWVEWLEFIKEIK